MKRKVLIEAPVFSRSGYGDRSRDLIDAFKLDDSWDVYIFPTSWGTLPDNVNSDNWINKRVWSETHNINSRDILDLYIKIGLPNEMRRVGKYNILFTAGIETDTYPDEWAQGLNQADKVIFSSEFVRKNFTKKRKLKIENHPDTIDFQYPEEKTEVLFEGYDEQIFDGTYKGSERIESLFNSEIQDKKNFLFIGHWVQGNLGHDRKDISGLIFTFLHSFYKTNASKRPGLILKTGNLNCIKDIYDTVDKIEQIKNLVKSQTGNPNDSYYPNIYLVYEDFTKEELNDLMNHPSIVAHITFTKGEGFGRPILEATTTGIPLITTLNSGQDDFLDERYVVKVPTRVGPVDNSSVNDWIKEGSNWNHIAYNKLIQNEFLLKFYKEKHLHAQNAIRLRHHTGQFTQDKMHKKFLKLLNELVPEEISFENIVLPDLEEL